MITTLGLEFQAEKHGAGPERLGFHVLNVEAAIAAAAAAGGRAEGPRVVVDPDGRKIELTAAATVEALPASWAVWRQDDNGNRFLISSGHTRADAERLCSQFEQRGHKQLYWASPEGA